MARKPKASDMKEYLPWVEKYRPKSIEEIAHQTHVVTTLRKSLQSTNLPHLLFYGPPGTGKTSTILALALQLYGPIMLKERVLELNASDERGINIVRHKIKNFAQYAVNNSNKDPKFPCPPYKIVILDEADSMTRDAQTALRRTMEKYSKVTRFCLICNYVSRIIAPVASRCAKFRFQSLNQNSMSEKLSQIAQSENVILPIDTRDVLIEMSQGDLRKCITLFQSASLMRNNNEPITVYDITTVAVKIPQSIVEDKIINACKSNSFDQINDATNYIISEGYPISLLLSQLLDYIIASKDFINMAKAKISICIAEADKNLTDGASEFLQLLNVLNNISTNLKK